MKRCSSSVFPAVALLAAIMIGTTGCPDGGAPLDPPVAEGNRAPRITIIDVITPTGDGNAEQGDTIRIDFNAEDSDDRAFVTIFASASDNPTAGADRIPILSNFPIGPGTGGGQAFWRTTTVTPGSYFIFGEIDDRTFDPVAGTGNPPVLSTFTSPVLIAPKGTGPENVPPELTVELPASDGGFTNGDVLSIRYTARDANSDVDELSFTYFFDQDRNAANDATQPPLEMGEFALTSGSVAPGTNFQRLDTIPIDLNDIPVRIETDEGGRPLPYFLRVRVDDGKGGVVNAYAPGAVRILRSPDDVVDLQQVGGSVAGAIWQGFDGAPDDPIRGSRAGSAFAAMGDLDGDGLDDFAIAAETASPFGANRVGEVYLLYGRERRVNQGLADVLPFSSGRYAGVLSLNTVGSFVPFPPTDERYQTIFNIRGSVIPQLPSITGETLGVTSIASIEDMSIFNPDPQRLPITRELLIGCPFGAGMVDLEDDDPCDSCVYDPEQRVPIACLETVFRNDLNGEVQFEGQNFLGGQWLPVDPDDAPPLFPPNVDFELDLERIAFFSALTIQVEGSLGENAPAVPFTVDFQLENSDGPSVVLNVTPNAEGDFNATFVFPLADLTLPAEPGESVPPSLYDGVFLLFARPSTDLEEFAITVRAQGSVREEANEAEPIKTIYGDGFPNRYPDLPQSSESGFDPITLNDLTIVCPPVNRTMNPLITDGFGNRDAQSCDIIAAGMIPCAGPDSQNGGDNISDQSFYESGLIFVNAGDDLVMRLVPGVDTDNDGTVDSGGTWLGDGFRVAPQSLFGQPPYLRQGGLGMRGGRFRGAWWNPVGVYDPRNLFGYTVDSIAEMDAFGPTETELLASAPAGGVFTTFAESLAASLAASYSNDPSDATVVTTAVASVDFGVTFNNVTSASLFVSGFAQNGAIIQLGLDDGAGGFVFDSVREALLWNGASPSPEQDGLPEIVYGDLIGDAVNFNIELTFVEDILQQFRNGSANLRVSIRPDCAVEFSSFQLNSATLVVTGLLSGTGYVHMFQGNDYTSNQIESFNCPPGTNGDPESGEDRPMSWPSFNCPGSALDIRTQCGPSIVSTFLGEQFQDALGFAHNAGDINLDGVVDFVMGAPGSDNDPFDPDLNCVFGNENAPLNNNGKVYLIYGTPTLNPTARPCDIPERLEVRGSHNDDQFGRVQGAAGDLNGDDNVDLFVGAEGYDADNLIGLPGAARVDAGFVGVIFGREIDQNAAQSIRPEHIGTPNFPGVKFIGGIPGARLGGGTTGNPQVFAGERGQHGVSSAGDFNRDGFDDLLITAPGQAWPGIKIEFLGNVADGDTVTINAGVAPTTFEFDLNNSVAPGNTRVALTAANPLSAQQALVSAMSIAAAESIGVSAVTSRTNFPFPLPDTPTVTFLRRQYSPNANWVTSSSPNVVVTSIQRQGVAYLVFGSDVLLHNKTFTLPQDINRRDSSGNRVLKGMIFVSAFEKNSGGNDTTPDEAPIEAVSSVGDIDGDGFVDIILGAPQADLINIIAPNERRQAAGEAYLIYGNEFGFNRGPLP